MMLLPVLPLSINFYAHPVVCSTPQQSKATTLRPDMSPCLPMAFSSKPVSYLSRCSMADAGATSQKDKSQSSAQTVSTMPTSAPQSCWGHGPWLILLCSWSPSSPKRCICFSICLPYSQSQLGFS